MREFNDGKEDLLHYLRDTVQLAGHVNGDNVVDLRNRLDNIYSDWLLRFDPLIEHRILEALERMMLEATAAGDRLEAAIAVGTMRSLSSLPALERAANDPDPDVRKYAKEALEKINQASITERSHDERIRLWESLPKTQKTPLYHHK